MQSSLNPLQLDSLKKNIMYQDLEAGTKKEWMSMQVVTLSET